jgi:putative MFS transporter
MTVPSNVSVVFSAAGTLRHGGRNGADFALGRKVVTAGEAPMSDIADRLERLPYCNVYRRLLFMGGMGYVFDAMDGAIIGFVPPVVSVLWGLSSVETGVLGSATYIGFFFGAICAGTLGDLLGRRFVMMSGLAVYNIATAFSALALSWPHFFALRVVAGFGLVVTPVPKIPF